MFSCPVSPLLSRHVGKLPSAQPVNRRQLTGTEPVTYMTEWLGGADVRSRSTGPRQTKRLRDPAQLGSASPPVNRDKELSPAEFHQDVRGELAGRNQQRMKGALLPIHTNLSFHPQVNGAGH